ncbi:MAG: LytR C-terminal domain-containing protein [Actinomycetota bacterium]
MPGKHAPESPMSFYLSVGRAAAGAIVVLAVVALIAVAAVGSGGKKPKAQPTVTSTPTRHATATPTATRSPTASPTATPTTPSPKGVTVNVLNGTTRAGLARTLGTKLTKDGYVVKTVGNAAALSATTIYYQAGKRADAEALLALHPELGKIQAATSAIPVNASLTVVIGSDYPS